MKQIYAVVDMYWEGQLDRAYTSEVKAYKELKKLVNQYIAVKWDVFSEYLSEEDKSKLKKLLRSSWNMEVYEEVCDIVNCYALGECLQDDFYILPIELNP